MTPQLLLGLLLVACFSTATFIDSRMTKPATANGEDNGLLARFMGRGRKLFANQFFVRSDVYFHSGYYPSMFDQASKENHLAENAGTSKPDHAAEEHVHGPDCKHGAEEHVHGPNCKHGEDEHDFLGKPKDFMDAFSRHFIVSEHTHLTEKGTNAPKEILPWLRLAAKLDPNKVDSYTVAAFWLRDLNKKAEAEEFLREGLRYNPHSYELLFELGRSHYERKDYERARNLWQLAVSRWRDQENSKPAEEQDRFKLQQILNNLAAVEARLKNPAAAVEWLTIVKKLSPHPEQINKRIEEVRAGKLLDEP
jgi:tetratricopeptide (TPR) repeat protein